MAYQAYGRGLGAEFIGQINGYALKHYTPDVTVFIDLTPEAAFSRKHGADENDRLEQAGMAFHKRVYEGYKTLAQQNPERFLCVDGNQTPQEIFEEVVNALKERGCL
jgi:dTMP kinase